jgi:hypothetical protein
MYNFSRRDLIKTLLITCTAQCPDIPFIIVGLKSDLRTENSGFISPEEGHKLCELLG